MGKIPLNPPLQKGERSMGFPLYQREIKKLAMCELEPAFEK
jgi:hypothetical protein